MSDQPPRSETVGRSPPPGWAPPGRRGARLADSPAVSVVVALSPRELEDASVAVALEALRAAGVELILLVGDGLGASAAGLVERLNAQLVRVHGTAQVADMKRAGLAAAGGDVVALADAPEALALTVCRLAHSRADTDPTRQGRTPRLSVIVPAHQASAGLHACLQALCASHQRRSDWELVVVDDASTDDTELIAAEYADVVVRLAGNPHGPAYARNRGAEVSCGRVFIFVDADVLVHPDVLTRFAKEFEEEPRLEAVFGAYDADPRAPGLVSQYRNLLHHYVHRINPGPAETFWGGLGAVRRQAFSRVGGFDEWYYSRPQIEDIELGRRLRAQGCEIHLAPEIQGTHLKRWTLQNMLATDLWGRGVPWMWLLFREGRSAGGQVLNVSLAGRLSTGLIGAALLALAAGIVTGARWAFMLAGAAVGLTVILNARFYAFLARRRGIGFSLQAVPLHLGHFASNVLAVVVGWLAHVALGDPVPPASFSALAQARVKTWPPAPRRQAARSASSVGPDETPPRRSRAPTPPERDGPA